MLVIYAGKVQDREKKNTNPLTLDVFVFKSLGPWERQEKLRVPWSCREVGSTEVLYISTHPEWGVGIIVPVLHPGRATSEMMDRTAGASRGPGDSCTPASGIFPLEPLRPLTHWAAQLNRRQDSFEMD